MAIKADPATARKYLAMAGKLVGSVEFPAPPTLNNMIRFLVIQGRVRPVPSKPYKQWQTAVAPIAATLRSPVAYPVALTLTLLGKWNRQRDIDNVAKPVLDSLVRNGALAGDNLTCIARLTVIHRPGEGEPTVRVEIEEAAPGLFGG